MGVSDVGLVRQSVYQGRCAVDGHRLVRRSLLVGPARSLALLMYLGGAGRADGVVIQEAQARPCDRTCNQHREPEGSILVRPMSC